MVKFGLFTGSSQKPDQEFEGDHMTQDKEFVKIYKHETSKGGMPGSRLVVALRLDKNQHVREI
jgi:hypothetical protein